MKFLCVWAHPDDETVAMGGTVRRLVNEGHEIVVVAVTSGGAGEVAASLENEVKKLGSVVKLREMELAQACRVLGVARWERLGYRDGEISNRLVWGKLRHDLMRLMAKYQPAAVVTFDHTGWYFHLDHVGVSIATSLAVKEWDGKVDIFFHNLFRPEGIEQKWPYVYPRLPVTHEVAIATVLREKVRAIEAHRSQAIPLVELLRAGRMGTEYFRLVSASERGEKWLESQDIFVPAGK